MGTKMEVMVSIKKGSNVIIDEAPCKVTDIQISRPGKHGHAKVRLAAVGLIDSKKRIIVKPGHDKIEVPIIDKRTAQVLSVHGDSTNVMDVESYETFDLKIPEELSGTVTEGATVLYWEIVGQRLLKQVK